MPPKRDLARLHILAGQHFALAAGALAEGGGETFCEGDEAVPILAAACGLSAKEEPRELGRSVARSLMLAGSPSRHRAGSGVRDARDYGGPAHGFGPAVASDSGRQRPADNDGGHVKTHRAGRKHSSASKRAIKAEAAAELGAGPR